MILFNFKNIIILETIIFSSSLLYLKFENIKVNKENKLLKKTLNTKEEELDAIAIQTEQMEDFSNKVKTILKDMEV